MAKHPIVDDTKPISDPGTVNDRPLITLAIGWGVMMVVMTVVLLLFASAHPIQ